MTTEEIFASRLRLALEKRGMTQKALCRILGVADWTVHSWCAGKATPRLYYLPEIARELGVTTDWLLGVERKAVRQ